MFRHVSDIARGLAVAVALISILNPPHRPASAPTARTEVAALAGATTRGEPGVSSLAALPADAAGGWRFPLGLKACALSVGMAIAGLAFVSVAPLGALNAFTAGALSMLYTCG